ncbi:molybdopterin-guanine dinucleotide biosynthesis protein MobB [Pedobacter panaciterrae]|uniref:DUF5712 family protein n=1 Tax=Pedobacter panaciterrae TaxID=363849 RepID=UPI00155DC59D|nr:DUF5712 family protein [Pedobacter panaciterrae]NQX52273.1 molybdopterin-guanine dinucleotide biosynthesis protein MobB [Pedobacter panaciterrae]
MYINITDKVTADNKDSSNHLIHYLEKENRTNNKEVPEHWFNHQARNIEPYAVRRSLDGNNSRLRNDEAKFFLINISPSQKELKYLIEEYGQVEAKERLKEYVEKVMTEYARNFKKTGIDSNRDLLWFAKVENNRYYSYKDQEVKDGSKRRGDLKTGNQMHVQVIVSRKDITGKFRLSPMNSSRGKNAEHSKKMGQFDRVAFKQSGERLFDETFGFKRELKETMAYANIKKNGSIKQMEQLHVLEKGAELNYQSRSLAAELVQGVAQGLFSSGGVMLKQAGQTSSSFFEIMLEPVYDQGTVADPVGQAERRRIKRKKSLEQGHEMGR